MSVRIIRPKRPKASETSELDPGRSVRNVRESFRTRTFGRPVGRRTEFGRLSLRDLELTKKDRPPARAAQHVFAIWQQNRSGLHESWGRP